ncbi:MAG: hypothetical protein Q8L14_38125 [Myxococcales bacterium]|nr:hypothetical protein [Myxococcales bacterium]
MNDESRGSVDVLRARLEQVEQALADQLQERAAEAAARRTQKRRLLALVAALVLVAVPFIAREALAAGCPRTGSFIYLTGLHYFCAEDPALADEVNANTQALVTAVEQKVGQLGNTNVSVPGNLSVTGTFNVGLVRGSSFDGCYFSSCPAGTTPLFGNVTCAAGVRVGNSNASGNRWYGDCGTGAACAIFVEAWCSRVLR